MIINYYTKVRVTFQEESFQSLKMFDYKTTINGFISTLQRRLKNINCIKALRSFIWFDYGDDVIRLSSNKMKTNNWKEQRSKVLWRGCIDVPIYHITTMDGSRRTVGPFQRMTEK